MWKWTKCPRYLNLICLYVQCINKCFCIQIIMSLHYGGWYNLDKNRNLLHILWDIHYVTICIIHPRKNRHKMCHPSSKQCVYFHLVQSNPVAISHKIHHSSVAILSFSRDKCCLATLWLVLFEDTLLCMFNLEIIKALSSVCSYFKCLHDK